MNYRAITNSYSARIILSVVFLLFAGEVVSAQQGSDPMAIYAPDFVMQHQQAIALSDEQKKTFKNEIMKLTARFNELQWDLQEAGEVIQNMLKENPVDENRANAQLDKILNIEREIKHLQLTLAIRIKNLLTDEQRTKLQAIKSGKQ